MPELSDDEVKTLQAAAQTIRDLLDAVKARQELAERRLATTGYPAPKLTRRT